jgi:hypothetical protein
MPVMILNVLTIMYARNLLFQREMPPGVKFIMLRETIPFAAHSVMCL